MADNQIPLKEFLGRNPYLKLLGKGKLKLALEKKGYEVSDAELNTYFDKQELNQTYKRPVKLPSYRINAPPYSYQIDVVCLPMFKHNNKGKDRFLIMVDILSRKMFAYVLASGTMNDVLECYKKFMAECGRIPYAVSGDDFFNHKEFRGVNEARNTLVYTSVSKEMHMNGQYKGNKLGIVDRAVRTIKSYLTKHMAKTTDTKWTKYLSDIVALYNETPHSSLPKNYCPNEMYKDMGAMIKVYEDNRIHNANVRELIELEEGTKVRAMVPQGKFDKEKGLFSNRLYTVVGKEGNRMVLALAEGQERGNEVERRYMPGELMEVDDVSSRLEEGVGGAGTSRVDEVTSRAKRKGRAERRVLAERVHRSKKGVQNSLKEVKGKVSKKPIGKRVQLERKAAPKSHRKKKEWWCVVSPTRYEEIRLRREGAQPLIGVRRSAREHTRAKPWWITPLQAAHEAKGRCVVAPTVPQKGR